MNDILIVEDEFIIRAALKRLLERNRYRVTEAESVEQAQKKFDLTTFNLIIADLWLPGVPGTEIIAHCNDTPVLIMTSYSSVRNAVEAMKQGAVDFISKPFNHDELLMVIKRVLADRQAARQNLALKKNLQ
jgi:DNA-binding NtrC family response regulator